MCLCNSRIDRLPEDHALYVWWCKLCPFYARWMAMTTQDWVTHVNAHVCALQRQGAP